MPSGKTKLSLICVLLFAVIQTFGAPTDTQQSLVVSTTVPSSDKSEKENALEDVPSEPQIYQMHIQSNIGNRFANTTVTSKVKNLAQKAQEATFSVVLPETAFISGFIMEVDGKNYTAYVKEKEEAKREYEQAVSSGLGAAHVAVSARDSNRFTVSVNVEPETKAAFYLWYEELLQRQDGHYEQVINIHPGQPVKDLHVEVSIKESRKIKDLKVPPLRSGNEIGKDTPDLDPRADIETINDKTAIVRFIPNVERQKQFAHLLGTKENEGLAGQFIVQYDVERDAHGGEILIQDGYFVHFFAPSELAPLPKYVVFVLDTSSSMHGQKIVQLKEAMHKILEQLNENDAFSLVEFNTNVKVWDLNNADSSVWYPVENDGYLYGRDEDEKPFTNFNFPNAYIATTDNINKAKTTISKFSPSAATDIYTALKVGLHLVEIAENHKVDSIERQPLVVFLTDGDPTVRLTSREEITNKISEYNIGLRKSPIFALSFGFGADKDFLQKLALRNSGFSKHIYEAADAALQLQDFYKQISSPLLADVTFKYEPSVTSLTKTKFPIHFGGSELVVSGRCGVIDDFTPPVVDARSNKGRISLRPQAIERSISNIERLWAYLTIKQLLDKKEIADDDVKEIKKQALELALEYSFVTSLSSLVVVKPNATSAVDTEEAEGEGYPGGIGRAKKRVIKKKKMSSMKGDAISSASGIHYSSGYQHGGRIAFASTYAGAPTSFDFPDSFDPPGLQGPKGESGDSIVAAIPSVSSSPAHNNLLTILPWLKNILNENEMLSLPSGTYKLGLNETFSDVVSCPKTPLNSTGHCTLLHSCPQVHSLLTSADVFIQHFCVLKNEYAGVCCPDNS
ncbi:hypothetical protein ILUMI_07056 [Ignelater luminosus]|uniref:Inter-alpha-trypsin inhibitor heavy chain H4-like n=1 Tax=Ignelater luminosus TaxID=2038154 RepID=A0A8K0D8T4_IGNLU|nr:hypothetical protein ILUMI_07056 [Ignelater luminosus]